MKAKVKGSQLQLYKAKKGSRKHEAIACIRGKKTSRGFFA